MTEILKIRPATKEDMEAVHSLICELAVYEHAGDEVTNTVEQLKRDGFGEEKVFECLVADINNEVVGFALFYTSYSTWKGTCIYLEDFLVTERMRRKGIGEKLFNAVHEIAKQRKAKRFEWQVLEWNTPAIEFYKKANASLDPEWINGKIMI